MANEALVSGRVADVLGKAIVHGDYSMGSILPSELELCEQFGVSRTGVREALKMLGAKGLIAPRRRVGGLVTDRTRWSMLDPDILRWMLGAAVDHGLLKDLVQLRLAIEPAASHEAAVRADATAIDAIRIAVEAMAADPEHALAADIAFHIAVLKASGNRFFLALCPMVESALAMSIPVTNRVKHPPVADVDLHLAIYRAIRDGQADEAAARAQQLMVETLRLLEAATPPSQG